MREIKFRAFVIKETIDDLGANMHLAGVDQNEELIQVRDISFDDGKVCSVTDEFGKGYSFSEGNLISVMQNTGLKDSHGNEIYEGDILSNGVIFQDVYWDKNKGCFACNSSSNKGWSLHAMAALLEIVGNKFTHLK